MSNIHHTLYLLAQNIIDEAEALQDLMADEFGKPVQIHDVTNSERRMVAQKSFIDSSQMGEWIGRIRHRFEGRQLEILAHDSEHFFVKAKE